MFPCGNVPHLNIVFFLSPGRIRPRQGILFACFSQKEKQAPPFLSKRKGGKRNFTCLNFSAVQICTAHVSSVQPDRRDKTIFCRGVCSVAPLCKGSWRGFAVTEGLTAGAKMSVHPGLGIGNNPSGFADANPPPLTQGRREVCGSQAGSDLIAEKCPLRSRQDQQRTFYFRQKVNAGSGCRVYGRMAKSMPTG